MKTITTLTTITLTVLTAWTASLTLHNNFESLEIVPEWNGPDYKVTYRCQSYKKLKGLHMEDNKDGTVTVNYGAFGRRYQEFKCN